MTGRFFARDMRDAVIDTLGGSSSGFNTMLSTIDGERGDTTPTARDITYKWGQNQFQFLMVDVEEEEVEYDDAPISLELVNLPTIYKVFVKGAIKSNDTSIEDWIENWIEALQRVLHNYNAENVSWIAYIGSERSELYTKENSFIKTFAVEFEARTK